MQPKRDYVAGSGWQKKIKKMKSLPDKTPVLIVPAMVADSNPNRTMFGGWLMGQVDIAGSIPAIKLAQGPVVTASVKAMNFNTPLLVGDLVTLYAEVSHLGRTSVTVDIDVWVQRHVKDPVILNVADAQLVFVAVDDQGKPRVIPRKV